MNNPNLEQSIKIGDRVRVEFWPMKNDLIGDVLYIANQPGDSWIICSEDRLFYVQNFSTISKRVKGIDNHAN
jgi:hypothetical protein